MQRILSLEIRWSRRFCVSRFILFVSLSWRCIPSLFVNFLVARSASELVEHFRFYFSCFLLLPFPWRFRLGPAPPASTQQRATKVSSPKAQTCLSVPFSHTPTPLTSTKPRRDSPVVHHHPPCRATAPSSLTPVPFNGLVFHPFLIANVAAQCLEGPTP